MSSDYFTRVHLPWIAALKRRNWAEADKYRKEIEFLGEISRRANFDTPRIDYKAQVGATLRKRNFRSK